MCVSELRSSPGTRFCSRSFQPRVRGRATRPPRAVGRTGGEGDRDRGPPSPYIISSPERVAIISRQWPTDRSASQKDSGPIIAATHRPRRSGQSWGPTRLSRLLFSSSWTNSFLPRPVPRCRLFGASRARRHDEQVVSFAECGYVERARPNVESRRTRISVYFASGRVNVAFLARTSGRSMFYFGFARD